MKKITILLIILLFATLLITACSKDDVTFYPSSGVFDEAVSVEILTPNEENADVYYTTDGTEPTQESTLYTEPIDISSGKVIIKALIAGDTNVWSSEYGIANYGLDFVLENENGDPVARSDFEEEGKYLHVEFSADWCGPCHNQGSIVTEAHEELINQGYNINTVVVIAEESDRANENISSITLDNWVYMYELDYVVADESLNTLYAYSNAYLTEDDLAYPFNAVIKYESGQWIYAADWCGGVSEADDLVSYLSSIMSQ